ncbi:hypothetical protein Tco_1102805 [Tanacetum coccineum]
MVPSEEDKVERFIWGLPDSIQGNVTSSKPTRIQEAIQIANSLMDPKVRVHAARQAENKRRIKSNPRDDHVQQPPYKRQNVARAYIARPGEKKEYARTLPLSLDATTNQRAPLRNQNRGSQVGSSEALGRVYALGGGEVDQDPNNISDNVDA